MSRSGTLYIDTNSPIHKIDGSIKFILLLIWTASVFLFNDFRVFLGFFLFGFFLLKIAKIPFKSIKPLFLFIIMFTIMNSLFLIVITPEYGSTLTGTTTPLITIKGITLSLETVWFAITLSMKYLAIFPIMMLFIFTTHPSKFASSLNKIGVSYKVAYAINIALRYIPDVKEEFTNIMHAQEARGVPFRKGDASLIKRLKNYNTILLPLVLSSLNRVEVISNAMDLRGFGSNKKRTWYSGQKYKKADAFVFLSMILLISISIYAKLNIFKGFWYPFN
ncbi:energy-coupling factor transporter transmembrane protein EcfT [uncultured Cetobacterium sp.]|uniref:energy-coupling factor transporter transmembrane component T family protein n=1 Tax=uncultured Cetobacterium sp. TaxID=527638 RepID=UPI0026392281|nr:energy-coupling factor transporter transmembrane component T [uncultured Cetobacterium sp.]